MAKADLIKGSTSPQLYTSNYIEKNPVTSVTAAALAYAGKIDHGGIDGGGEPIPFVLAQTVVNDITTV